MVPICVQDYFGYQGASGLLVPAAALGDNMLVVSLLSELMSSGAEYCMAAGESIHSCNYEIDC